MTIGEKIKRIRKERGLTQKELGAALGGISQQQVGQWETGKANPKIETIKKIAEALNVDISELSDFTNYKQKIINKSPFLSVMHKSRNNEELEEDVLYQDALHHHMIESLDITEDKQELLYNYNKLNDKGKEEALKRVSELTEIPKYQTLITGLQSGNYLIQKPVSIEENATFEMITDDDKKEEDSTDQGPEEE